MDAAPNRLNEVALLYVEDEPDAREMLARMLALNYPGLKLHLAGNGVAGLELFREHHPDLVLTDLNMPVMNGIQMSREIRGLDPEALIVAITAYSDTSYLLSAIEIGINHYVLKPVNYPELFSVIDRVLDQLELRRQVALQLEKLRRREQQLGQAQRISHLGSWEWDLASGAMHWSDELYRICGLLPEQIPASRQALLERLHPEDRDGLEEALNQACEECRPASSLYFRLLRPDGSTRIIRGQIEVVCGPSGGPVNLAGTWHDVTELKWAEAALRASEQRFLRIFQATPDLLSINATENGAFLEVNQAFLDVLGFERSEVIGRTALELGLWADPREEEGMHRALAELGELRDLEVHLKSSAGREITGLLSAEHIEINRRRCLLILVKDISERKEIELEQARFASIVESSRDAIMATGPEGTITLWNSGTERLLGVSAPQMRGKALSDLAPEEKQEELAMLCREVLKHDHVVQFEAGYLRPDGARLQLSLVLSPLRDQDGEVVGISAIARDVTERAAMEERIRYLAHHDPLTDLPNRKLFMDFLALELAQARRNRKNLAVLYLDLDHFKQINDTLGHRAGDLLLQAVAHRLKECVRESDTVARIGGDEFNVLMPDLNQTDDVGTVVGKIMGVFETPFLLDKVELPASTSIGVSMFPADGDTGEELVQKADSAMYVAKQVAGNAYQFYNAEINVRTVKRRKLERELRQALNRGELELLFQPQVRLDTGRIVGAEALLRWRHPEEGLLLPAQFLNVAEETGVIVPVGEWALRQALVQMKQWQDRGHDLVMTVNLSNRQFHQPNLVEMALQLLAETGLDARRLELDLTEGAIMEDPELSIKTMRRLADQGVRFAVDDFGTGSSSLQWIRKLPIDKVKIDRSFMRHILTEPNDLAVVAAAISMSHNLRLKAHVVGVESPEQLALVRNSGCDEAQGNLIGMPLTPADFELMAANQ